MASSGPKLETDHDCSASRRRLCQSMDSQGATRFDRGPHCWFRWGLSLPGGAKKERKKKMMLGRARRGEVADIMGVVVQSMIGRADDSSSCRPHSLWTRKEEPASRRGIGGRRFLSLASIDNDLEAHNKSVCPLSVVVRSGPAEHHLFVAAAGCGTARGFASFATLRHSAK